MAKLSDLVELLDGFADAWNRHDLDALMSMMTDDCVFQASAGPQADGERSERKQTGCDLLTFRDGKIALKNSYRKNRPAAP